MLARAAARKRLVFNDDVTDAAIGRQWLCNELHADHSGGNSVEFVTLGESSRSVG